MVRRAVGDHVCMQEKEVVQAPTPDHQEVPLRLQMIHLILQCLGLFNCLASYDIVMNYQLKLFIIIILKVLVACCELMQDVY
jgi:hypothetical protein